MADKTSRLENQLLHFSKQGKWDKVESLWPQIVEDPIPKARFYSGLSKRAVQAEKTGDLKAWVQLLMDALAEAGNDKVLIQVARGVLRAIPDFEELRQPVIDSLRSQYEKHNRLDEYIEASGILQEENLQKSLGRFLQFVQFSEGQVYRHAEWGVGKVTELDLEERRVKIEFPKVGAKSFSFSGVKDYLDRIPRSHFLALRLLHPEQLAERAEAEPLNFIKFCLKHLGGKVSRTFLKEELTKGIFSKARWNRWWTQNRDSFRFDPYISFTGTLSNPELELRDEPKSFHEEMLADLSRAENFARKQAIVQDMLKMRSREEIPEKVVGNVFHLLEEEMENARSEPPAFLECLYLIENLLRSVPNPPQADIPSSEIYLLNQPSPPDVIQDLTIFDYQIQACKQLQARASATWTEEAEHIFLAASTRLGQWLLKEMVEGGQIDRASHMAEQLMHRPEENTDLFLWLVRSVREGKWPQIQVDISPVTLFNSIVQQIETCKQRIDREDTEMSRLKGERSRLQNVLLENHQVLITEAFEELDSDAARTRYQEVMDNAALDEKFKLSFDAAVRSVCHDLDVGAGESEDEGEHFVTAEALERHQKEMQQLKSVEIPENSKAIGAAAALGDLSENAEYDAAKEKQKILFRRLESLEDLLERARVMDPAEVDTSQIGFGTAFRIKNQDRGQMEYYRLLGIWDADLENNILSYRTPFGKQFLGKGVGEKLVVQHPGGGTTRYEVVEISNALKQ